ncbi:putative baseplate assembly protein [Streptomyces sp. NPDC052069]|uniref:putative baseplate assembly protein n=1 Tax=Streptomyces sp. NPDC052069 TaxID=3154650 RepID=UPI0034298A6F
MSGADGCGCGCGCGCGGHDERRAPDALYNPPGRTALDYRVGDYGSFLAAMVDRLASPAYPALRGLTVRTPDDPAIGLLDSWAVVGDLLTFHSERIVDEAYLRTANEHRSLALLGRLVGHRPRPGIAADTHLAYTLDRDPRDEDVEVVIPRGARSNSVPLTSEDESQVFETSTALAARASWNELAVRRRRPSLLTEEDLSGRSEIQVAGTSTGLTTGDRLLFVFKSRQGTEDEQGAGAWGASDGREPGGRGAPDGREPGQRLLRTVARLRIDREEDVTGIGLQQSAPPSLAELVDLLREWITEDERAVEDGEPTPDNPNPRPVSRYIEEFDTQVLAPLRADLDTIASPARLAARLAEPHERLAEAQAVAGAYEEVAAWFEQLEAMVGEVIAQAADLEPSRPAPELLRKGLPEGSAALRALGAVLPALRGGVVRPGARAGSSGAGAWRRPAPGSDLGARQLAAPGSDLGARLLAALDPRISDGLYPAWRQSAPTAPALLHEVQALRVTSAPFGAMAPLRPVQDERGRVIRQADWPLSGSALTTMRVVFDTAGRVPVRAEFQYTETGSSVQQSENLSAETTFELGPGRVTVMSRAGQDHDLSWLGRRPADSQEPGVTARLHAGLPERTLFVSRPGEDGLVHVVVHNGESKSWRLAPGDHEQVRHDGYELTVRYTVGSEPANVVIGIASVPEPANRRVIALDSVQDSVTVGSWVAIERPRKGAEGPDGIPGDPDLRFVTTRVTAVRTAVYTDFGITGRGTELTLADPWLDEHDVLLSTIRDTAVHAGGQPLRLAEEPLGEDVHGNELELAELYDGLRPGRQLIVSGERTDVPAVTGTELVTVADVEQVLDPMVPGDHVHTRLTLTTDLVHRYRRATVRVRGNVVAATHGESREEPIGSGDADRINQTFALWQSPLTWLPADNPLGATPALEVRVDGLLWHEVDSLAGRGPRERVYVGGVAGGRTTVTFGDGVHGARLPSGHENVRARYRFGTGRAANVRTDRITQAVTRPLGVTQVTNPQPATGGADADGPGLTRSTVPLAVSALDRLVSVADYEDFARSRAGIGRAAAREIFDGRRRLLHVTVAGVADIPVAEDSDVLTALRSSLARYGDSRLPVRVQVRELVLLLLAAKVQVARDHSWELVEPRLRQALLARFGPERRELGDPARLSDVLATAHSVPGVGHVDVDVFDGVPASLTPEDLLALAERRAGPRATVPVRLGAYDEDVHRVTAPEGETLTSVAARYGIGLDELLRLNPDITDTRRLAKGRAVFVFRGIRPAQLALLSPDVPDTLILTEVTS